MKLNVWKEKKLIAWEENRRIEFHFGRNQWSSMCNYKDETKKKTREKTKNEKKNAEFDLIVIEDDSVKRKQKKRKYQIEEDEDNDLTLDDLKKISP